MFVLYKFFRQFCRAVGVEVVGVKIYRQPVYGFVCRNRPHNVDPMHGRPLFDDVFYGFVGFGGAGDFCLFMLGNVLHVDAETLFQVVMAQGQLRVHRCVGKDVNLFALLDQGIEHFAEMLRKTGLVGMQEPTLRDKDHRIVFDFLCDKAVVRVATIGTAVALRQEEAKGNAAAIGRDNIGGKAFLFAHHIDKGRQVGGVGVTHQQDFAALVFRADSAVGFG